jgi:radial spoke head protein 9
MELDHLQFAPEITGRGFSVPERAAIAASVVQALDHAKLTHATMWGKVFCQKADYIVLLGHSGDPLARDASVFVSTDNGVSFALLPLPSDNVLARKADQQPAEATEPVVPVTVPALFARASQSGALTGPYIGDPAFEYRIPDALSKSVFVLKEADRLACFIALQLRIGRVVPRGAFLRRDADVPANRAGRHAAAAATDADIFTVRANAAFEGLDAAQAGRLASYVHLRRETKQRLNLEKEGTAAHLDWLDPLSEDEPAGCWTLQYRPACGLVVGNSLELLGATFYHKPGHAVFGSLYMGDGNVNRDLPFQM